MDQEFDGLDDFEAVSMPTNGTPSTNYNSNNNSGGNNNSYGGNNSYGNKKPFEKKVAPKRNVTGEMTINLWDKEKITPVELDSTKFKEDVKIVTMSMPSQTFKMNDDDKKRLVNILNLIKGKGYKLRFICNYNRAIYEEVVDIFGMDNLIMITPWLSYCKESKEDTPLYLPSDANLSVAAHHVKNFANLSPALQYIYTGVICSLYGQDNTEPSSYYITWDPFKKAEDRKVDFSKSKDTANYFILHNQFKFTIYNVAFQGDYADLEQMLL